LRIPFRSQAEESTLLLPDWYEVSKIKPNQHFTGGSFREKLKYQENHTVETHNIGRIQSSELLFHNFHQVICITA